MTRRLSAATAALLAAGVIVTSGGVAGAAPQPTAGQVQKKLNQLMTRQDQAIQQYDQAAQALASARQRLALASRSMKTDTAQFQAMRRQIAQIAATEYENGTMTSAGALLTSSSPQRVLSQASILQHLSSSRSLQLRQFVTAARRVTAAQQAARRTELAVAALAKQRKARKKAITTAVTKQQALLSQLTAQQQAALSGGGTTIATYTGTTATAAGKAVAFAYAQLGKPYVWGATGPGSYDCSGLVQAAWAAIRVRGRLQARYNRLVRRFGGPKNPAAKKKAIVAIAHTLLKIAYSVLKSGTPYQDLGEDFCTRRETPAQRQAWLERQIQKLHPGCTVTIRLSRSTSIMRFIFSSESTMPPHTGTAPPLRP